MVVAPAGLHLLHAMVWIFWPTASCFHFPPAHPWRPLSDPSCVFRSAGSLWSASRPSPVVTLVSTLLARLVARREPVDSTASTRTPTHSMWASRRPPVEPAASLRSRTAWTPATMMSRTYRTWALIS